MNEIIKELDMNKIYKVVFYARVSTEEEKQINALEKQIEELTGFINSQINWCLVDKYIDEGKTGTTSKGRHEYNRLFDDMLTNKFDIVVIKDISRLNRNAGNYYQFINRITTENKKLYLYLDRKFYSSDDAFLNGIKAMMAEEYSRDLSKKILSASQRSINNGVAYGNSRIYGYDKIPKSFVINEEEAKIIRQIFDWYISGYGFRIIQRKLTEMGIFSSTGTQFSLSTLKRIIKNEKYKGVLVSGKTRYNFDTKKTVEVPKDKRKYIKGGIPAIVSEEVWEKANSIIKNKAKQYDDGRIKGVSKKCFIPEQSALSGKIFCAKCGKVFWHSPYTTKVNKLKRDIWMCSTYKSWGVKYCKNISIEFDKILAKVKEILFKENQKCSDIEATLNILKQTLDDGREKRISSVSAQIEKYNNRLGNLTDLLLDGIISKDDYISKKSEILSKIDNLQNVLKDEERERESYLSKEMRLVEIRRFLETNVSTIDDITDDDIRKFIKIITVSEEEIIVETNSGNTYTIDADDIKMKFAPRNKAYLERIHQNLASQTNSNI